MKLLTPIQLRDKLAALKSATPIAFTAITKVEAKKKGFEIVSLNEKQVPITNPFTDLRKIARISAFTGNGYQDMVNRQAEREGKSPTFQSNDRQWGNMASPALVEKDGKFYLAVHIMHASRPIYMEKTADGLKLLKTSAVVPFLPSSYRNNRQQLEKQVVRRDYSLESIVSVTLNGEKCKIIHDI